MGSDATQPVTFEVCIDSVAGAIAAEQGGAHRVELCANLLEGGTTPSTGMIRSVRRATGLPIMVMIRPRGGHFCFDATEIATMRAEAEAALAEEIDGIVVGALHVDGRIDQEVIAQLVELAASNSTTFHRAFDQVADPLAAIEQLIRLKVDRVLTSGQASSASVGLERLRSLVEVAQDRISVMPGCGVRAENIRTILLGTRAKEIHFSGGQWVECPVDSWRETVPMSATSTPGDLRRRITSASQVRAICQAALVDSDGSTN